MYTCMNEQREKIEPKLVHERQFFDDRGKFMATSLARAWIQTNVSTNKRGALRGMHFQIGNLAQTKLVRVLHGSVVDVVVDLHNAHTDPHNLPVYAYYLNSFIYSHNHPSLYVPRGFAHGFLALEDNTIFEYKVDAPYSREMERSIHWQSFPIFDEILEKYNISSNELKISEKDAKAPYFDMWLQRNENVT